MASKSFDHLFGVLEVSPHASDEVLHAAFKALMVKNHPDRHKGNDRRAKEISEAYQILSDPKARARYTPDLDNLEGMEIEGLRIIKKIAKGGFGCTYKAEHLITGELVCIKDCSNFDARSRDEERLQEQILIEEARAMWNLRHYSVPAVRNVIRLPNRNLGLIMSFIPGPTITQIWEELTPPKERLDPEHVAWITERVLNALRYIHYQGVIHGDLKPHNIIIEPYKHLATIVDFGLSKVKPREHSGNKGYTDLFSAPEVLAGGTIIPESDFYSLGMTMIFALSGTPEHVEQREVPHNTPAPMKNFIKKLIVRNPLDRPQWPNDPNTPDLWDEFLKVRTESFGRSRSKLKPIPGNYDKYK